MPNKFWSDLNNFAKVIPGYPKLEGLVDSKRDPTQPICGSIVYCNLKLGPSTFEHSGIYIGNGKIVELQGKKHGGGIVAVDRYGFIEGISDSQRIIWVACYGEGSKPIGDKLVAQRAEAEVGNTKTYHLLRNNCHRFTSGCITGNFNNNDTLFVKLRDTVRHKWGNHTWRKWG
ncbi:MAG: lecithin retinol acyltransferase family protein [Chroococcales cyanobacterium]|jgi:hypothetical protein